jgi:hypothetical protein
MARFDGLDQGHRAFIEIQEILFVTAAASRGRVSLAPKEVTVFGCWAGTGSPGSI